MKLLKLVWCFFLFFVLIINQFAGVSADQSSVKLNSSLIISTQSENVFTVTIDSNITDIDGDNRDDYINIAANVNFENVTGGYLDLQVDVFSYRNGNYIYEETIPNSLYIIGSGHETLDFNWYAYFTGSARYNVTVSYEGSTLHTDQINIAMFKIAYTNFNWYYDVYDINNDGWNDTFDINIEWSYIDYTNTEYAIRLDVYFWHIYLNDWINVDSYSDVFIASGEGVFSRMYEYEVLMTGDFRFELNEIKDGSESSTMILFEYETVKPVNDNRQFDFVYNMYEVDYNNDDQNDTVEFEFQYYLLNFISQIETTIDIYIWDGSEWIFVHFEVNSFFNEDPNITWNYFYFTFYIPEDGLYKFDVMYAVSDFHGQTSIVSNELTSYYNQTNTSSDISDNINSEPSSSATSQVQTQTVTNIPNGNQTQTDDNKNITNSGPELPVYGLNAFTVFSWMFIAVIWIKRRK